MSKSNLAMAYAVKRRAGKAKKMANGGIVSLSKSAADANPGTPMRKPDDKKLSEEQFMNRSALASKGAQIDPRKPDDKRPPEEEYMANHFFEGGLVSEDESEEDMNPGTPGRKPDNMRPPESEYMANRFAKGGVVDAIKNRYAQGGEVADLEEESEEQPNQYYGMNQAAANEPQYDDDQLSAQPMDSNEHGDDGLEHDLHDMVGRIKARLRSK